MENFDDFLCGKKNLLGNLVEYNSSLKFGTEKKHIVIEANKEGLLTLAKFLIDFAYDDFQIYPSNVLHLYPSDEYSLEALNRNSKHVYIKKI